MTSDIGMLREDKEPKASIYSTKHGEHGDTHMGREASQSQRHRRLR